LSDPLFALIDPRSPRYAGCCRDVACDFILRLSADPELTPFEGCEETELIYLVDLETLSSEQLDAIVVRTVAVNAVSPVEMLAEYREFGLPIAADASIVCEDPGEGRLRFPFRSGGAMGPAELAPD
jgi:hypothetical protein